jgi:hypothetical protein
LKTRYANISVASLNFYSRSNCVKEKIASNKASCFYYFAQQYYYTRATYLTTDIYQWFLTDITTTTELGPGQYFDQYFIIPFFTYIITPIAIIASIFNLFMIREILDPVSTLTYHQFETIIDIAMMLYLFYKFHLPELLECFVSSFTSQSLASYYKLGSIHSGETLFYLVPVIVNTLLAIDRCRSVTNPLNWKVKYGTQKYTKRLIVIMILILIVTCVLLNILAYIWAYIIDANRESLNLMEPIEDIFDRAGIFGLLRPLLCEFLTISVSFSCIIIQIRYLYVFIKTLKQQLKNGTDKEAKRIRSTSELVIGTIGTQMFLTIIFLPSNINTFLNNYHELTHMDVDSFYSMYDNVPTFFILIPTNILQQFIRHGEIDYWPKICIFSSTITIAIHLLTCPAYRRGAKRFIKRIFCCCCKKDNKVGMTVTAATKHAHGITHQH